MKPGMTVRSGMAALFGVSMVMVSSGTELDTVIAKLSARLDPIETFTANAYVYECG